jgi:hypothetical protein
VRRVKVLIEYLPADSAYRRVTDQHWSDELELAATNVELLHALIVLVARAFGSKRKVKPLRVPRPGQPTRATGGGRRVSLRDLVDDPGALLPGRK